MWFFTTILALSLCGLLALFFLKAREQAGKEARVLAWVRRRGDAAVSEHLARARHAVRHDARELIRSWLLKGRANLIAAEVAALSFTHKVTSRIHERLLHRRKHLSGQSGEVSAHLKNVLESTKEAPPKE